MSGKDDLKLYSTKCFYSVDETDQFSGFIAFVKSSLMWQHRCVYYSSNHGIYLLISSVPLFRLLE